MHISPIILSELSGPAKFALSCRLNVLCLCLSSKFNLLGMYPKQNHQNINI